MVRFLRRSELSSNMNPRTAQIAKLLLVGLGVLLIIALVAGSFIYGNQKRERVQRQNQESSEQEEGTPAEEAPATAPPSPSNEPNSGQNSDGSRKQEESARNEATNNAPPPPSVQSTPSAAAGAGGAQAVPNTGPEDYAAFIAAGLVIMAWMYRRSRHQFLAAASTAK